MIHLIRKIFATTVFHSLTCLEMTHEGIALKLLQLLSFNGLVPPQIICLRSDTGDVTIGTSYTKKLIDPSMSSRH